MAAQCAAPYATGPRAAAKAAIASGETSSDSSDADRRRRGPTPCTRGAGQKPPATAAIARSRRMQSLLKRVWSRDQASFVKSLFSRMSDEACARASSVSRWKCRFWGAQSCRELPESPAEQPKIKQIANAA